MPPLATLIERGFAGLVIAVCGVLLVRLVVGERRRYRFDAALHRLWRALLRGWRRTAYALGGFGRWRAARRHAAEAERMADDVIQRARDRGEWDGNVYRPKSFRNKPPRDKMH